MSKRCKACGQDFRPHPQVPKQTYCSVDSLDMKPPKETLQESVAHQRESLVVLLQEPMRRLAAECVPVWGDRAKLDSVLGEALKELPYCKHLYALDANAIQISDNVSHEGLLEGFGRDQAKRPYLREVTTSTDFFLSDVCISLRERRHPSPPPRLCATLQAKHWDLSAPISACATCR